LKNKLTMTETLIGLFYEFYKKEKKAGVRFFERVMLFQAFSFFGMSLFFMNQFGVGTNLLNLNNTDWFTNTVVVFMALVLYDFFIRLNIRDTLFNISFLLVFCHCFIQLAGVEVLGTGLIAWGTILVALKLIIVGIGFMDEKIFKGALDDMLQKSSGMQ